MAIATIMTCEPMSCLQQSAAATNSGNIDKLQTNVTVQPTSTMCDANLRGPWDDVAGNASSERPSSAFGTRSAMATMLIITSNLLQMISNIIGIVAGFTIASNLGIRGDPSKANWIAASYPLTQGSFVLIAGRLGAVYGHKTVLLAGCWMVTLFSLVNGFCTNYVGFASVRALTGIGGAMIMPNAVAMLSITVPPGRLRNLSIGIFAASAPLGGWLGALLAGILKDWRWIFWFLAISTAVVTAASTVLLPKENPADPTGKIDYLGATLGVMSLILFNFVWNQAPAVGWSTSYIIAILFASVVCFSLFILWESQFAKEPIMPLSIFQTPTFSAMVAVVILSFMAFATSLWYMIAWQQLLRHWSPLQIAIGWIPFGIGAIASTLLAAWMIPRFAAQWIIIVGAGAVSVSNLLLATMPQEQSYWRQTFPAIVIGSFCPDLVYTAAQIIASNSVNRRQQGIAASLIGTLNLYGCSLGLGFAGTIESQINKNRATPTLGYRSAFYFGAAIAAVAIVVTLAFVRVPKNDREGWDDGDDQDLRDAAFASGADAQMNQPIQLVELQGRNLRRLDPSIAEP